MLDDRAYYIIIPISAAARTNYRGDEMGSTTRTKVILWPMPSWMVKRGIAFHGRECMSAIVARSDYDRSESCV